MGELLAAIGQEGPDALIARLEAEMARGGEEARVRARSARCATASTRSAPRSAPRRGWGSRPCRRGGWLHGAAPRLVPDAAAVAPERWPSPPSCSSRWPRRWSLRALRGRRHRRHHLAQHDPLRGQRARRDRRRGSRACSPGWTSARLTFREADATVKFRPLLKGRRHAHAGVPRWRRCSAMPAASSRPSAPRSTSCSGSPASPAMTRRFVEAVRGTGVLILDTRKTTPGLRFLEKYAVRAGGGRTTGSRCGTCIW